jgi:hypothetical protein
MIDINNVIWLSAKMPAVCFAFIILVSKIIQQKNPSLSG